MKTLLALPLILVATAFVAAEQVQTLPPRPPAMGGQTRDPGMNAPMPTGTGLISGSITSVEGGRPMRRASVRLQSSTSPQSRATLTDDQGRFEFKDLPAGEFTLRANKPGYLEAIYGQKRPGSGRPGTPLSLKEAQHLEKLTLQIPKGGVITGTIVDDVGEPAFGVPVRAMRYAFRNGERSLVNAGSTSTDDRGIYRIAEVERLIDEHERIVISELPEENHMMFLWQVLNRRQRPDERRTARGPGGHGRAAGRTRQHDVFSQRRGAANRSDERLGAVNGICAGLLSEHDARGVGVSRRARPG